MKVNYHTHPVLEKLERKSLGQMPVLEKDSHFFLSNDYGGSKILQESFKRNCHYFKEIVYVSSKFLDASVAALPKLAELYKDITVNDMGDLSVNGTFIFNNMVFFISHKVKKGIDFQETCCFIFHRNGTPLAFYETGIEDQEGFFYWASNHFIDEVNAVGVEQFVGQKIMHLILISMFKSYASVETKYIAPKSKTTKDLKTYRNDTNLGITYLTSKWFTNLVRSEGFTVRGHFRLQPKKVNGEWTKELIWIDSFEKSGYTSKAQILDQ